ncbi:WSC domain containing protein [Rhypophila decipiens]
MAPSQPSLRAASLLSIFAAAQALSGQSNQLETRQSPTFSEIGCFVDGENGQALKGPSIAGNDMTVDKCANFCGLDYKYFGVEYGSECFCGNEYAASTASSGECSFSCAGNPSQTCGAGNRINIYNNRRYSPRVPGSVEGKLYQGCFVDNGNPRVLPSNLLGSDVLTAELYAEHCDGYAYFGLEHGRECWCGTSAPTVPAPESECSFPCAGNDRELCGAGGRINVFGPVPPAVGDFSYQGCFTDNNDDRVLSGKVVLDGAMTVELC